MSAWVSLSRSPVIGVVCSAAQLPGPERQTGVSVSKPPSGRLNIAKDRGYSPTDITEMYTEYGMCPRCQGPKGKKAVLPQLRGDVSLTYWIPFANPATR